MPTKKDNDFSNNQTLLYDLLVKQIDNLNEDIKNVEQITMKNKEEVLTQIFELKDILLTKVAEASKENKNEISTFKETQFHPLQKKTDSMSLKLGIVVTILLTVGVIIIKSITTDAISVIKSYKNIELMNNFKSMENNEKICK